MLFISNESELNINNKQSIYFYSNWIPFHKKMLIMIDKIERKHNINFMAVNVDNFKSLCKRFNINSIPTIIIIDEGNEIKRVEGLVLTSALKSVYVDIYSHKAQ